MPMTTDDDEQAAHRRRAFLDVVALGAFLADPLAEPERVEEADIRRHQDDHQGEGEEDALDQLGVHRAGALAEVVSEPVDQAVEPDPARRLDQDDVAVAQPRQDGISSALRVRDAEDAGRVETRRQGPIGDPDWRPRPTTTSQSTVPAAASPTTR